MKLYSYSSDLNKFIEVKWIIARFVIGGFLIGIIVLFVIVKSSLSAGRASGLPSPNTLTAENNFLRHEVSLISPRVSNLETQVDQLNKHADKFQTLLLDRKIIKDTVSNLKNAAKSGKEQTMIYAAKTLLP